MASRLKDRKTVPVYCYQCVAGPDLMRVEVEDGIATRIESLDLSSEDRIHDRQLHRFDGGSWTSEILIP